MFSAWPVTLAHRVLNNRPIAMITPFPFSNQELSVHFHVWMILDIVSWLFIFWAIWLYITGNYRQDKDFKTIFAAHFFNLILDLPHYLLAYKQWEWVCALQGMVIVAAAICITYRSYKKKCKK